MLKPLMLPHPVWWRKISPLAFAGLLALSGALALPGAAAHAAQQSQGQVRIGEAVEAELAGNDGVTHRLSDYRGRIVVLEWTSPVCEFTARHYASGAMQNLQKQALAQNVVWIPISSTGKGAPGFMDAPQSQALMKARKIASDYMALDASGTTGRYFSATATPSVVIVDAQGRLVYSGAIDDKPFGDGMQGDNHVRAALADLFAGAQVRLPKTRAYGCSITYANP